jgi:hypothetical protein
LSIASCKQRIYRRMPGGIRDHSLCISRGQSRKVLLVSPFAVFIGIFNPILDTGTVSLFSGISVSAGWLSFLSILLKFALTISAALLLVATTSFPGVCHALKRLGFPALFVSQLLFLYRYLFVLMEEAMRIIRARDMRSFGSRGAGMRVFVRLVCYRSSTLVSSSVWPIRSLGEAAWAILRLRHVLDAKSPAIQFKHVYGNCHPSHSHTPLPMIHSLSSVVSQETSSVIMVIACR